MPTVGQIFPPSKVTGEMLPARVTPVEIEGWDYQMGTNDAGQPEPWYRLYLRGWPKPMGLNKTNAQAIATVLQEDDLDRWIGQVIGIKPAQGRKRDGSPFTTIEVDLIRPSEPGQRPPAETQAMLEGRTVPPSKRLGGAPSPAHLVQVDLTPVGEDGKRWMLERLAAHGGSWDAFSKAVKYHPDGPKIVNVAIEDIPRGYVKPLFQQYMKDEHGVEVGATAEVVNTSTGEVQPAAPAPASLPAPAPAQAPAPAPSAPAPAEINEDDIPF